METLISSWGFSSYVQIFQENKIDVPTLHLLNFEALGTLIPLIGDRLRFLSKLEDFKKNREVLDEGILIKEETREFPEPPQSSVSSIEIRSPSSRVPEQTSNSVLEYLKCPQGERIYNNYFGTKSRPKAFEEQSLDVPHQNLLAQIIIDNEFKNSDTDISRVRLEELATNIEEIFPNEKKGTYFIPYSSRRANGKVIKKYNAQGKLWWKYSNVCKVLLREGTRTRRRSSKKED